MHKTVKTLLATTALFFSSQLVVGSALASSGCAFDEEQSGFMATCSEEKQEVIITGIVEISALEKDLPGYAEEFENYQTDAATISALKAITTPTNVVVIIGTWCPDCHRETPRFMKLIEEVANPNITVTYIGVDRSKLDPEGLAANYDFTRIPTFIVEQDNKEIGRIVESPEVTLEQDLLNIVK
ncbi:MULTISPECIES: thioredoxin family protein [Shewanella]|uniref:Thioredoxin n=1 Tax=Shewanella japonica TaxID=93973 RepID=A0ABM6JNV3_9GAMM|nr:MULTISPECIES: thioredoxin family protein [Shewanella]ARD23991.1 Thioredoxin [Shewanella japonica]KPZ72320.1 Thioredoxin [Shewanella sp. P1-14-1]